MKLSLPSLYVHLPLWVAFCCATTNLESKNYYQKKQPASSWSIEFPSKNFVNFWSFKDLADYWFIPSPSSQEPFDPALPSPEDFLDSKRIESADTFTFSRIQPGDIIFVRKPSIFLEKIHPHIKAPYIIVTHGHSVDAFKKEFLPYLKSPSIIAWFSIHAGEYAANHEKLVSLPLGIRQWPNFNKKPTFKKLTTFFKKLRSEESKTHLLYMNFNESPHKDRSKLRQHFSQKPYCLHEEQVSNEDLMTHMARCKFTLAPQGTGSSDTFRLWESLIVGSFPIVKRTNSTDLSLYEGLPVLFVNQWEQITVPFLEQAYKELTAKKYSIEKLYIDYWIQKILAVRKAFLESITGK